MKNSALILGLSAAAALSLASAAKAQTAATAQITLQSTTGNVNNYDITLNNTGSTPIGTFWFSWIPGQDYLPTAPSLVSNPTGWSEIPTGSGNAFDGTALQWEAHNNTADFVAPGSSLIFGFSTVDTPAELAGFSPSHPTTLVGTSTVYSGGTAFDGTGDQFTATVVSVPEPASLSLLGVGAMLLARRTRRTK